MFICGKVNVFLLVAIITITLSFLLQLLAVSLPNWLEVDQPNTKANYLGLFQICISITNHEHVCRYFSEANVSTEDWWKANAALQTIGLFAILVAMIIGFCALICCTRRAILFLIGAVFAFVGGIFILIGLIVFGAESDAKDMHASFFLALFALALAIVSGIFFLVAKQVQFT